MLQITDAMNEAVHFINEKSDPPWLQEMFIDEEIGIYTKSFFLY